MSKVKKRTVYVLCHEGSDVGRDVYVGSTLQTMTGKMRTHKKNFLEAYNKKNKLFNRMRQVGVEK